MTLCFSDIETREAIRRLKEVAVTFGFGCRGYHTDTSVTSDIQVLQKFVSFLRQRELKRHPWFGKSPQIKYRKFLVDYIMKVSTVECLSSETTYQAIYLVDRFMDQHDIVPKQLGIIATVCISISGKLLESNNHTPKYSRLVRYLQEISPASTKQLVSLEGYVLDAFSFDILVPTEINFLEIYLLYIVDGKHAVGEDDNNNNNNVLVPNANYPDGINVQDQYNSAASSLVPFDSVNGAEELEAMNDLAILILEHVTRSGVSSNIFQPSRIAAAILMAARRQHGLNFWTPTLQRVTSYSLDQVCQCLKHYIEPKLAKLDLTQPFTPPYFLNVTFQPYLLVEEDSDEEQTF